MGFDLHGLNPKINTPKHEVLTEYKTENGWTNYKELENTGLIDKFFEENEKWQNENPGSYFRNNVWWWRPLWTFICNTCDDILTEEEQGYGDYNDGKEISEKKAIAIADRIQLLLDNGDIDEYIKERKDTLDLEPDDECDLCGGTGTRNDTVIKGECNKCDGKGHHRPFITHYHLDKDNIIEFERFCRQSGGFNIC